MKIYGVKYITLKLTVPTDLEQTQTTHGPPRPQGAQSQNSLEYVLTKVLKLVRYEFNTSYS